MRLCKLIETPTILNDVIIQNNNALKKGCKIFNFESPIWPQNCHSNNLNTNYSVEKVI